MSSRSVRLCYKNGPFVSSGHLHKEKPNLADFLETNDFTIMTAVHDFSCAAKDAVIKHLSLSFVRRNLPKVIYDSTQLQPDRNICRDERTANDIVYRLRARIRERMSPSFPGGEEAVDYSVILDEIHFLPIPLANVYFGVTSRFAQNCTLRRSSDAFAGTAL
jgi:hypothetical protein